jgi:hypothetical protein
MGATDEGRAQSSDELPPLYPLPTTPCLILTPAAYTVRSLPILAAYYTLATSLEISPSKAGRFKLSSRASNKPNCA